MKHRQSHDRDQPQHLRGKGRSWANYSGPILHQLALLAIVGMCVGTAEAASTSCSSSAPLPDGGNLLAFAPPTSLRAPPVLSVGDARSLSTAGRRGTVSRAASFSMTSVPVDRRDGGVSGRESGRRGFQEGVSSPLRAAMDSVRLRGAGRKSGGIGGRGVRGQRTATSLSASTADRQPGGGEGEGLERGARFSSAARSSWRSRMWGGKSAAIGKRRGGGTGKGRWSAVRARSASTSGVSGASGPAASAASSVGGAAAAAAAAAVDNDVKPGAAGDGESSAAVAEITKAASFKLGSDLMADLKRRVKLYKSDWTDGANRKSLPAIMFLYFACLLPAVAFGGIATQVTQGTLGVIEYVVSCGLGGMAYATFSGQPMTFIGPTGLTLAFMTSLYSFTSVAGLPFLPVYAWVGLWTSAFLSTLAFIGASNLIEFATQFTDDVFNALLSVNFIYEAVRSIMRNFTPALEGFSQAGALLSLNVAVVTYMGCRKTSGALSSKVFNRGFREFTSDFGPLVVILAMSTFCGLPSWSGLLSFLEVPSSIMLCNGRSWLVPMLSVSPAVRMACALPAVLLTSLFFLDQNISSRVVNSPRHKMVKGPAYHQDMLVLGIITGVLSLVGLPWQCAATVQSLNHVRQMATFESTPSEAGGGRSENIESIHETRVTGFCVHALVLGSLALLPQLAKIPMAVVSGIFLYLGRKVMSGNGFLIRCKELIVDRQLLSGDSDYKKVAFGTAAKYTAVQAAMLALLWTLKSFKRTALFFPSVIGLLIVVRLFALPKMFTSKDLSELDAAVG